MRRRYVQINGELVEYGQHVPEPVAPLVMPDIEPYQSQIDGRMITSRSAHREHLRDNGFIECGNDSSLRQPPKPIASPNPKQLHEILKAQVNAMTHEQFKAAGKRDLERLIWNTRGIPDPVKEI